ncbi:MAG: GMP synthase [Gammaproteobacteria bacterium]|nr:MAG: GMP synthase [Gammaproteobacteria bacterium]
MRIGILRCDKVRSTLSAEFGEYPHMIEQAFTALNNTLSFQTYCVDEGQLPECTDECDAYIITGSRHSVFDPDELWINPLRDFIVRLHKAKIKTVAICFGHQLMAEAMGGKVERADNGWQIGVHETTIAQQKTFMQPYMASLYVIMMCEDQIQTLPESATVLATSQDCQYMMLQYDNHFLSIQAHPEFSLDFAKALLNICQDELPAKRLEKGLSSLSEDKINNELIFRWFLNFLTASDDAGDNTGDETAKTNTAN